jgi:SNF2 family DNA or RNA helicase
MKIVIPHEDENGDALSLNKFQEHSIRDVLHTLEHGAVVGTGTARGALLGDIMGAGKTIQAIAVVNTVPRFRRVLVICMASAVEKVWVEHIRRWQTRDLRLTPIHAHNTYDIGTIPSGWVIINYALLKKHDPGSFADIGEFVAMDLSALCSQLRPTILIRRRLSEIQKELPPLTRKTVIIRHADHDGDVASIDAYPDDIVEIELKSNGQLQSWFADMEMKITRVLGQLSQDDLLLEEKLHLEETLKTLLTVCRARTGACKHNVILPYLMQCRQKTVVFGWHRDLIEDLAAKLRQQGRGVVTFIGGTKEPDKLVERFQNDENIQLFLGNLDCASTSITLTAANHVVLAEQSWVPSDEDQAIARVWRTGQKQPVSVVKFILENSLDERMQAAQDRKREFIAHALDGEDRSEY